MFGGIKVNEYWRKRYNKELMQLFGDLDTHSFVRVRRLNCIGHVNNVQKRKINYVFNNNPQRSRLKGWPRIRWWNYVQTDINSCKIKNWKVQ